MEVVFGSPDNFRSEELIFDIVPFHSGYHALLGRTAFARFNAVPHYAYLKLKMPGPCRVITVNGNTECSLRTEEHTGPRSRSAKQPIKAIDQFGASKPGHLQARSKQSANRPPGVI